MFRICLLAAALLLTGCSEPKRDPLMIGSEVFLNSMGEFDLLQKHIAVTEGTKLRIVAYPGTIGYERPQNYQGPACSRASTRASFWRSNRSTCSSPPDAPPRAFSLLKGL